MSQNYTPEFKKKIVRLHEEGRTYRSITAEYGVSKSSISKWCGEFSKECQANPEAQKEYEENLFIIHRRRRCIASCRKPLAPQAVPVRQVYKIHNIPLDFSDGKEYNALIEKSVFFERKEMLNIILILEGIVMCFVLLIVCVIGIANGPVGLVLLYEKDVQQRVVELGLTSKDKIRKNYVLCSIAMFVPLFVLPPLMVYGINGVTGFWDGFWQMSIILWIQGLFDRFFIDWYWVGKTKAWEIPGTEDLKPYIPAKVMIGKWFGTIVLNPLIAAVVAGVMLLF